MRSEKKMTNQTNNGTGNKSLPDRPETTLTDEAERLIKHVFETPLETDEQLTELGEIYTD